MTMANRVETERLIAAARALAVSAGVPPDAGSTVVAAVVQLVESEVTRERARCAALCRDRAALWRRTPAASSEIALAREEARARANEAAYLADLLEETELEMADA